MVQGTSKSASQGQPKHGPPPEELGPVGRVFWSVYRFLASLKLAVVCLLSLSVVLAYATSFESEYGAKASHQVIYQSWWFGILLAFLGANIFCAASIRFPWKKRQLGFVVTHAGLLIVLLASVLTKWICYEGSVWIKEGSSSNDLIDTEAPALIVRDLDSRTGKPVNDKSYVLPFRPGAFAWSPGRVETLSQKRDPFKVRVSRFLPASIGRYYHARAEDGQDGSPMIALDMKVTPPNASRPIDVFEGDIQDSEKWFVVGRIGRRVREVGGVQVVFQTFQDDDGTKLADFLNPPPPETARFRYQDNQGTTRTHDWAIADEGPHGESADLGKTINLPESDIEVKYEGPFALPASIIQSQTGDDEAHGLKFQVRRGSGPWLSHYGWWAPTMPSFLPSESAPAGTKALVQISYSHAPHFDAGLRGQLEITASADGRLHHRYTNREGVQSSGPIEVGKEVAVTGGPNRPVTMTFAVTDHLPQGKETFGFVLLNPGKGKGEGVPAILAEMTVEGVTKSFWVRGPAGLESKPIVYPAEGPPRAAIDFGNRAYEVAYGFDQSTLPMTLELVDFDVRFDRGTRNPKSFTSKVLLTDEARGVSRKPVTITMNEPLIHGGLTFYQQSYQELEDPRTGRPGGAFMSVLHVRYDPIWVMMYFGCFLVIIGTFLQFYMRAGVFTDGGKKEREWATRRDGAKAPEPVVVPTP